MKKQLSDWGHVIEREERVFWIKGYKLRSLRAGKNMSLRQFAEYLTNKTGIIYDHRYVDRWERAERFQVGFETMKAIINISGVAKMPQTGEKEGYKI